MEIYKRILSYLSENDNGEFIDITHLDNDFKFLKDKARELATSNYIKIASSGFYAVGYRNGEATTYGSHENLKKLKAKILLEGHKYLKTLITSKSEQSKISKEKKLEALNGLIYELRSQLGYDINKVENFIEKASDIISYIDGVDSIYISEIKLVSTKELMNKILVSDWDDRLINTLEKLKHKIDFEEEDDQLVNQNNSVYVSQIRIEELKKIKNENFDLIKLVKLCEELNDAYRLENYYTVGMLVRTVMNHVPPIFSQPNFDSVVNQYKSNGNVKSFRESMEHLEKSNRKIADSYVHSIVRNQEVLPTAIQVDFRQGLDVLLGEIVRILK